MSVKLVCVVRNDVSKTDYFDCLEYGLKCDFVEISRTEICKKIRVTITNTGKDDFSGVVHIKALDTAVSPKVFMPGYMYNNNTADFPSSGRKAFPRLKNGSVNFPESPYFMTRSDRLAEPMSLIYDNGHIWGIAATPYRKDENTGTVRFNGFSCNIDDDGCASAGFTIGYENAPWLFVQTATVLPRENLSNQNTVTIKGGQSPSLTIGGQSPAVTFGGQSPASTVWGQSLTFDFFLYDYSASKETDIYKALSHAYETFYEPPRSIAGMSQIKAMEMLTSAIRDNAWLNGEKMYTGFVYDKTDGNILNKIGSLTWTNGLSVAVPMLLAANILNDEKSRSQALEFMQQVVEKAYNPKSGFLYEAVEKGIWSVRGWWYNGMHSGGHSSYLNGQAVYYLLTAYESEKERDVIHKDFIELCSKVVKQMNKVMNTDLEYPFSMSEKTGAGVEYDSFGSVWCLAATLLYQKITGSSEYLETAIKSEANYYNKYVATVEGYGGPLDTDKAVDDEGILGYIRAVRLLHELTGDDSLLQHLEDAIYYETSFKLGYNTPVQVPPLSTIGWSSCGGSITSVANPHIHPMSSTIISEMKYCYEHTKNSYIKQRMEDTINWSLQTFNTKDKEYGYGYPGWMSERFCFCQGLLTEKYEDGSPASTWFALMPWASASLIEGFARK